MFVKSVIGCKREKESCDIHKINTVKPDKMEFVYNGKMIYSIMFIEAVIRCKKRKTCFMHKLLRNIVKPEKTESVYNGNQINFYHMFRKSKIG